MKILPLFAISVPLLLSSTPESDGAKGREIKGLVIIEGTILKMSPPVPPSGVIGQYRLVKYRVERVCKGKYTEPELVVDHYSITGKELDDFKIGDRVYVPVTRIKAKEMRERRSYEGIRSPSDAVNLFYTGIHAFHATVPNCSYDEHSLTTIKPAKM